MLMGSPIDTIMGFATLEPVLQNDRTLKIECSREFFSCPNLFFFGTVFVINKTMMQLRINSSSYQLRA
jgi:hypothetical protein